MRRNRRPMVSKVAQRMGLLPSPPPSVSTLKKVEVNCPITTPRTVRPYFKLRSDRIRPRNAEIAMSVPNICSIYKWPIGAPGGGVIAIIELGGGWSPSDMSAYFGALGQPVPSITDVSVDGTKNSPGQEADVEVALDIQVAGAAYFAATGKPATIRVYWSADIATAVTRAQADGCDVCSISWGADEAQWGKAACQAMDNAAAKAVSAGMVVFAAAGDNDAADGGKTPANVDCPSSCPHIVGCGGTTLTSISEIVWNNDPNPNDPSGEGTGGGYSTVFALPSWQSNLPKPPSGLGRMVPDCAGNADPNTGYEIFIHGGPQVVGGTSAVAPLYAGLFAACGKKLGFITPTFYANPSYFRDIVFGGNGLYDASTGPDACTGMGSPWGAALSGAFATPAPPVAPPQPVPGSGTVTLQQAQTAIQNAFKGSFPLLGEGKAVLIADQALEGLSGWSVD